MAAVTVTVTVTVTVMVTVTVTVMGYFISTEMMMSISLKKQRR
jgi:hypothetical protein